MTYGHRVTIERLRNGRKESYSLNSTHERTKEQRQADEMDRQIFAIMMLSHQIPSLRSHDVQKLFSQLRAEIRKEMHPTDRKGTA